MRPEEVDPGVIFAIGCVLAAVAGAIGCLCTSKRLNEQVEFLKSAKRRTCYELPNLIDSNSQPQQSLIVAVSGRVGSATSIPCKLSALEAVLVKEQVQVRYQRKNKNKNKNKNDDDDDAASAAWPATWIDESISLPCSYTEAPNWYLDDGSDERVFIRGARGGECFDWPVEKEEFEEGIRTSEFIKSQLGVDEIESLLSTWDAPLNEISKTVGVKRTEWLLPTGTFLTVVGEAVRDGCGRVWIERPRKGKWGEERPLFVSSWTLEEIVGDVRMRARFWKGMSVFLMILVLLVLLCIFSPLLK